MSYRSRLIHRQAELGRPVRIALVGAGQMGRGFTSQVARIPGMDVCVIADTVPGLAAKAYAAVGRTDVVGGSDVGELIAAVEAGRAVAIESAAVATELPVDIVVEATGVPDVGARVALSALLAGKDVALLNVECDVTVGLILAHIAQQSGRVYTVCRGDEPVEAKRLVDYARDLSFEVICAGKGKNNPLNPHATPAELTEEALSKQMNPKMLASFVDGSKTMIEMAALANATGLKISRRGMNGPFSTVEELHRTFALRADGGVLDRAGVIDYCTGPVAPGVFVVVRPDDPTVMSEMDYLKMGSGPYFALYRPYHLASIEAPLSIAEAALDRQASLAPESWQAEVTANAKRDLAVGDVIDTIGGTTVYGVAEPAEEARALNRVPIGLLAGARLVRPVAQDAVLTYADVELDQASTIVCLRRLQDQLLAPVPVTPEPVVAGTVGVPA